MSDVPDGADFSAREVNDPQAPTSIEAADPPEASIKADIEAIRADLALLAADIAKLSASVVLARVPSQTAMCNAVRERIQERPLAAAIGFAAFGYALGRRNRARRRRVF